MKTKTIFIILIFCIGLKLNYAANAQSIMPNFNTVKLETGITFDLPVGYFASQFTEVEGGYKSTITIGSQQSPGYITFAGVQILIRDAKNDFKNMSINQRIQDEYQAVLKNSVGSSELLAPDYVSLFNNRAVRYRDEPGDKYVIGYVVNDIPGTSGEFLVEISTISYATGVENLKLFETILQSLRLEKIEDL